jgi:hypothetical protein
MLPLAVIVVQFHPVARLTTELPRIGSPRWVRDDNQLASVPENNFCVNEQSRSASFSPSTNCNVVFALLQVTANFVTVQRNFLAVNSPFAEEVTVHPQPVSAFGNDAKPSILDLVWQSECSAEGAPTLVDSEVRDMEVRETKSNAALLFG